MMKLTQLFKYSTGNLPALELTEKGNMPLVYGTTKNNGIIKLVKTYDDSKIYNPPLITVSYLGTAFVQTTKFTTSVVDKSNITILIPINEKMSLNEMFFYCYQINKIADFGYNYGRRMNQKQLNKLELIEFDKSKHSKTNVNFDLKSRLPKSIKHSIIKQNPKLIEEPITKYFEIVKGKGLYKYQYESGETPLVSATSFNNGILEYVDTEPTFQPKTITVERIKGNAFVQLKPYATIPDDIAVLKPKIDLEISTLFYFAFIIRTESWKYSYGRKFSPTRLKKFKPKIPLNEKGKIDEALIRKICKNCLGWNEINAST